MPTTPPTTAVTLPEHAADGLEDLVLQDDLEVVRLSFGDVVALPRRTRVISSLTCSTISGLAAWMLELHLVAGVAAEERAARCRRG